MTTLAQPASDGETVSSHTFIEGVELLTVVWPGGRTAATLIQEVERDVTPEQLRQLAEAFESFPEWLRARADHMEAGA